MDNQLLQTAILVLTIALLMITYKYQQQRNYIRDNVNKEEIPETNYPPINLEKFKIEKIKVEHTLTDIDLIYFDLRKENILDVFVYRLINTALFILFVVAAIFFSRKVIIILSVIFLVYNFVHSARTYLRYYRAVKHYEEWRN